MIMVYVRLLGTMADDQKPMTTSNGAPVENDTHTQTAGWPGPSLLQDVHFIDKMAHFDREVIPERRVHAKGAGAYGVFEVTHDVTQYTRAKFLSEIGKQTEVFLRFSTVGGERGSADTERDPRGFAVKFYTEEGNYDLVGNNTPVFFIRDPLKFPDFIHTQKRDPRTNLKSPNMMWDFWSLHPESLHQVTILFSDRGTPANYREMHGFGSHTFMWYTDASNYVWVKYHFKARGGFKTMHASEADRLKAVDADHATRDLFDNIESGNFPVWDVFVQIVTPDEARNYKYDIFDVTKTVSQKDFPLIPVGTLTLNRNPENYFAETEQSAFAPSNFVPGIGPSFDKMLQGRLFSYADTHRHRLGANHHLIPVNNPKSTTVQNYQRDGAMMTGNNGGRSPNYYPNTFSGPQVKADISVPQLAMIGNMGRQEYTHPNSDFEQPGILYREVMTEDKREQLIENIVGALGGAIKRLQYRQSALFYLVDEDYGTRVAKGLNLDLNRVIELSKLSQDERVQATLDDEAFKEVASV